MKLKSIMLISALLSLPALASRGADVKELWTKHCASCHGKDGRGQTKAGKKAGAADLTDTKIHEKFSDEQMFKAVKEGVKDGNTTKMKPAERLTDVEIRKLVAFVRTFNKK